MKTFADFLEFVFAPPTFQDTINQVQTYFDKGRYDLAWELIQKANPTTEEENSLKTHFIAALQDKAPEFLHALKAKRKI